MNLSIFILLVRFSLLSPLFNIISKIVFIKIKNLEKLFVKDSESEDDSFSNLLGGSNNNNIIKINNLYNINTYETDSFTEYVIKKIKNKTKYR